MNFLAHTFLSCQDQDMLAGNFMADFINNREANALPEAIYKGIQLHKQIDSFTDSHSSVIEAIHILRPTQGKYAPVTVDILFDYFLTQSWHVYSQEDLRKFTIRIYEVLGSKLDIYPPALQEKMPRMIANDFLYSCENIERLIHTFEMVAKRAKFDNHFHTAHIDLIQHEEALKKTFDQFFPELVENINNFCGC
jgi:acyl carrier protein phosphodiesterase